MLKMDSGRLGETSRWAAIWGADMQGDPTILAKPTETLIITLSNLCAATLPIGSGGTIHHGLHCRGVLWEEDATNIGTSV